MLNKKKRTNLLHFCLSKNDIIPPSLVWFAKEGVEKVLVDGGDYVIEVGSDVAQGPRDWRQNFLDILELDNQSPPVSLCSKQLNLRDATSNVGVEIKILLDGGHQDELAHQPVVGGGGAEIGLEHLENMLDENEELNINHMPRPNINTT